MNQVATEYERKHVYRIECNDCSSVLTDRGMNAVLLSDRSVQLFSTDLVPDSVAFVHGDYAAASCSCRVRDIACKNCGNVVGYHVNVPFLISKRNKYLSNAMGPKGTDLPLLWGFVRDAGDFSGGFFRSGDATAAKLSCQLSVHLASSVPLVVHEPVVKHVMAQTFHDHDDVRLQHVYYCR
ncbi:hypothetical protein HMPREF1544_04517 [Mucor circinelloides 1006PhL]|uniref:Yippee domain-containing protein n=1 Tax=Mucor circinelloides f. circinelloides (strain 1006PhL) TaxID=1220926 RepID=S2K8N9_MUCC1|nr:hypothetical protein HMPREF1544_04517 [Mucor circinelloides 1006PhL]